jgi:DNA repair photolyase
MHDADTYDLLNEEGKYKYFHRPEPRQTEGPVEVDDKTGFRYQMWDIGMVRNAAEDNRRTVKVFLDPIPHIIIPDAKPLQGWYQAKHLEGDSEEAKETRRHRPRPCMTESILTEPYGGTCSVGCGFCYINAGVRGYRAQGLTTVPQNYGDQVARQLKKWKTSAAGYICSFIDPFIPLEKIYHNSQGCAEAFDREGLPVYFLSRLSYPGWAYDLLKRNKYSYAQMSINTSSPEQWKRLSPWAIKLEDMIDQVRALHKAKIYISIQCNPIIAGVTDNDNIINLIHILSEAGADHIIFKFVETAYSYKYALVDKMVKQFGDYGKKFGELLTCNIGGQVTIDEEYRLHALDKFTKACRKAGITMATCYEYKYERDEDGKITSKQGISVGRDYLTADQCHGHRVPLFTRDEKGRFREVAECPPSGCLHCADDHGGVGACGSELFSKAGALASKDYRLPLYAAGEPTDDSSEGEPIRRFPRVELVQITPLKAK